MVDVLLQTSASVKEDGEAMTVPAVGIWLSLTSGHTLFFPLSFKLLTHTAKFEIATSHGVDIHILNKC